MTADPRSAVDREQAARIARNESRFREANERVEAVAERTGGTMTPVPFICECGDRDCTAIVRLAPAEYERVRSGPRRFVCCPGHELLAPGHARVIESTARFEIVEKLGPAGALAEALDRRTASGPDETGVQG